MKKERSLLRRLFPRTAARFLALWLLFMLLLSWQNQSAQESRLEAAVDSAAAWNQENCQMVLEGDYDNAIKPAQLEQRLSAYASQYGAVAVFRLPTAGGMGERRSQLTSGSFALPGTGVYSYYLRFDPVLTDQEHLELARRLRADRNLCTFYGTEGGLYDEVDLAESDRVGWYGTVTGVLEGNVVYPQKLVYYYPEGPVTVLDTDSGFFDGKELTTLTFDLAQINSPLVDSPSGPVLTLALFREAEARIDRLVGSRVPDGSWAASGGGASVGGSATLGGMTFAQGTASRPLRMVFHELGFLYGATLAVALLQAYYTARAQARAVRRERDFTRAAAHELKTPLAVLRAHAEALREDIDPARRGEYLDVVLSEADRMAALTAGLLDLSRLEAGAEVKREPVNLTALVGAAFARLALPMERRGLAVTLDLDPCAVEGDRRLLELLAGELAANAARHAAPGGAVAVTLKQAGDKAELTVDNDGPNIPPDELERIWEPFYRPDVSRSRDTGGTGLGLSLVKAAAEAHGGGCAAENRPGGVRFQVWLPCLQKAGSFGMISSQ